MGRHNNTLMTAGDSMHRLLQDFLRAEKGATAIEYAMIMALVFLAIVGSVSALGTSVSTMLYSQIQAVL